MAKASAYFTLSGLDEKSDGKEIKRELDALPGVLSVSVSDSGCVAVDYDTTGVQSGQIAQQLEKLGYQILSTKTDSHIM